MATHHNPPVMSNLLPLHAALLSFAGISMLLSSVGSGHWIFYGELKQWLIRRLGETGLDLLTGILGLMILGFSWRIWVQVL